MYKIRYLSSVFIFASILVFVTIHNRNTLRVSSSIYICEIVKTMYESKHDWYMISIIKNIYND